MIVFRTDFTDHTNVAFREASHNTRVRLPQYAFPHHETPPLSRPASEPLDKGFEDRYGGLYGLSENSVTETTQSLASENPLRAHNVTSSTGISNFNFYLDDQKLNIDDTVNALDIPSFAVAERLLNCYITTVHDSFPIVPKVTLVDRFYQYYASMDRGVPQNTSRRWLGMLNLVFAIGATYSHVADEPWRADGMSPYVHLK